MHQQPHPTPEAVTLRCRAEARLGEKQRKNGGADAGTALEVDSLRLVHELQVHQIELEMQIEETQAARDESAAGLEKYSDLYDFAPVGYLTLDRQGTIQEANLTGASLLGVERSRLLRSRLGLHVPPSDRPALHSFLDRVFKSRNKESCEITVHKKGTSSLEVQLEGRASASGRECRTTVSSITERRRAEEDRLIFSKLESTGILAGGIAHDFNNLLTIILLNLELAQMPGPEGKGWPRHLEEAKRAALSSRELALQLITFAKGGAPVLEVSRLSGLIKDAVRAVLSGSPIWCDVQLAQELWPAEVDCGQIGQAIRNILLNAREAMPQGGAMTLRAENLVLGPHADPPLPSGDYILVSVADQGAGMTKEVLLKIYDPYFSTKQRGDQKGMGLGLAISMAIIQKHGGTIVAESEVGVGTTFRLYLPAVRQIVTQGKASTESPHSQPGGDLVIGSGNGGRKFLGLTIGRVVQDAWPVGRNNLAKFDHP
jgi:two-component system cell cycle sensor histidine kinase/response regulator CckA